MTPNGWCDNYCDTLDEEIEETDSALEFLTHEESAPAGGIS